MTEAVSPAMRTAITAELAKIQTEENIRILFAIESGSRAWGFHSPDSDYDVRFVYARPVEWHLGLGKKRDVVERPISGELDLSGWDVGKALGLALKSNAVIAEWLQSPITYIEDPSARRQLTDFAQQVLTRRPVTWHHGSMLRQHLKRAQNDEGTWRIKRFFYALRPAMTLRWMRVNDAAMAPMHMDALMAQTDLPVDIAAQITDLIAHKKVLKERAESDAVPAPLVDFVKAELVLSEEWLTKGRPDVTDPAALAQASALNFAFARSV